MISLEQYQILTACFYDVELFYFPFAEIDFGGQLFHRGQGEGYAQYLEDQEWPIHTPASKVISELVPLVNQGFLDCWRIDDGGEEEVKLDHVCNGEFATYLSYECKTFDDHLTQYHYGSHEFSTTELGRSEMDKPEYRQYDEELGRNG